MREIDTEAPVVWPAWCYSANTQESAIDVISRKGDLASELLPQTATSPSSFIQTSSTTILPAQATIQTGVSTSNKIRAKRKNPCTTSTPNLATFSTASIEAVQASVVAAAAAAAAASNNDKLQQQLQLSSFLIKKSAVTSVEKMLSERMLLGFGGATDNNSSNNNNNKNKNCDNSNSLLYDKIHNESQIMDTSSSASILKNGDLSTNNNNNVTNSSTSSRNNIKRERLSPTANGDIHSSISRSRSATPSSFPGTPPQSLHPSDLSQNILTTVHSRSNDFQTRNYSDFMRSLAAKYNNSHPNDASTPRSIFFDNQKYASGVSKTGTKEPPLSPEIKRQSLPTPPQVPNVPFVSSLFSGLPFSSAVFPPLIDMSSTQALVTLARAAKEAEIQNILRTAQQKRQPLNDQNRSPSLRSTLTPTPQQQSAQFASQPFILPSQYHPPHQNPSGSSHNSQSPQQHHRNEPSSSASLSAALSGIPAITAAPLDLSSAPHLKRLKRNSTTTSPSISPSRTPIQHTTVKVESESNMNYSSNTSEGPAALRVEFPRHCRAQSDEINSWNVDETCNFVSSIDICAEYVQNFRDQCIDGSGLPLLTEDHLTNSLGMKLGPALKLRSILAKKLGGPCPCVSCTTMLQQQQQQQTHLAASTASSSISSTSSLSGSATSNAINNTATTAMTVSTASSIINNPRPASADSGS